MDRPRVGMGVIVLRDGRVLLGRRKSSHGAGTWHMPGGHLEFGEGLEGCARREVLEETDLRIKNPRLAAVTNDIFGEGKHYITLFMLSEWGSGEPRAMEPEKAESWNWFSWDNLPEPLFLPMQNLLKQGFRP